MKLTLRDQQFSTRRLTRLYIVALSTIAIIAILGQFFIQFALLQQSGDANVINIAGRQRMLSQKLTKAATSLLATSKPTARLGHIEEVRTTMILWERSQAGLQHGDSQLGLPANNSDAVTKLFAVIDPNFQTMIDASKQFLSIVNQDQSKPASTLNTDILPPVQTLLTQEPAFLTGMDAIVLQFQHEAEDRVNRLKLIEATFLCFTLLVLLLEGTLVFRPALQRLRKSISELVQAEQQVATRTKELEQKNTELELAFHEAMAAHRKVMPHARVVALGQYQVQGSQGNYYSVVGRTLHGNLQLECECLMYRRNLICSHSLAAATLHSALLRQQQHSSPRHTSISSYDLGGQFGG